MPDGDPGDSRLDPKLLAWLEVRLGWNRLTPVELQEHLKELLDGAANVSRPKRASFPEPELAPSSTRSTALTWLVCRRTKITIKASTQIFVSCLTNMVGNGEFNLGFNMAMKRAVQGDYMLMYVCQEAVDTLARG